MAFSFFEIPEHLNTTANPPTITTHWKAVGTVLQSYVQAYAYGATPAMISTAYGILHRQDIRVRQSAFDQHDVTIPYGVRKNATGQWTWDFDTTGGTIHITNSKASVSRYPTTTPAALADAPDQKGVIGLDGDQIKGTDIIIPALKFNCTFKHPMGVVGIPYAKYLASITGMVNSDPFLNSAPGEVLFLGARGSDGTEAEAQVSYQFAMQSNESDLTVGDIVNIVKKGWDVAWIKYEDNTTTVATATKPVRIPEYVYVERVYDTVALATALGFGG
jgi:hypothetical protein